MQPVESTPNYSLPVEYVAVLNFTELGYTDSEAGSFYYYYEATTGDGYKIYDISSLDDDLSHFNGPFIKPIGKPSITIESYSSTGSGVISKGQNLRYILTFSNYDGAAPSNTPKIALSSNKKVVEYEMISFYNSSDGTIRKYYIDILGDELDQGTYNVSFDVSHNNLPQEIPSDSILLPVVIALFSISGFINSFSITLTLLGLIPLIGLIGIGPILLANTFYGVLGGLILLGYTIISLFTYITVLINEDDTARLLGFSFACLLILIAMGLAHKKKGGDSPIGTSTASKGIFNTLKNWVDSSKGFTREVYLVISLSTAILLMNLDVQSNPIGAAFGAIYSIITSLFLTIPILLGVINAAFVLNLFFDTLNAEDSFGDDFSAIQSCAKAYKWLRGFTY
jgi:hypothetical protein